MRVTPACNPPGRQEAREGVGEGLEKGLERGLKVLEIVLKMLEKVLDSHVCAPLLGEGKGGDLCVRGRSATFG
eukprot:366130-Chlamydomonas_euryale.AAC.43